jgi:hypothetical protein
VQEVQEFHAHKLPLVRASEVFEAMLLGSMSEATTGVIKISDIQPKVFDMLFK